MIKSRVLVAFGVLAFAAAACAQTEIQPAIWASKPDVAGFEKIVNDRLTAADTAVAQITSAKAPRTIDNTLVPFDEAVRQINSAAYFSALMQQVHPDASFRDPREQMTARQRRRDRAVSLNRDVYQALSALDRRKPTLRRVTTSSGSCCNSAWPAWIKDDATRAQLKKLNDELTEEQSDVRPQHLRRPEEGRGRRR